VKSALYVGRVEHRRTHPVEHAFSVPLFMTYLDLAELGRVFRGRWLWAVERWAPASFRRRDHLGDPALPLDQAVREEVERQTGSAPSGPIRLLTQLRFWGYCFNPVSVYYCFDDADRSVDAVLAEVHNTPWNERHAYVLVPNESDRNGRWMRFTSPKRFHVSPFMGMDMEYRWRVSEPAADLQVHLANEDADGRFFSASLRLERREIHTASLARTLAAHPFMTGRILLGIYWQAFRLYRKGAPFHPHPGPRAQEGSA
jgi:DUF1365 family protein